MPKLTKYEKVRVLGTRAEQISLGAKPLIELNGLTEALEIAEKELNLRLTPLIVIRTFPNGKIEEIPVSEFDLD